MPPSSSSCVSWSFVAWLTPLHCETSVIFSFRTTLLVCQVSPSADKTTRWVSTRVCRSIPGITGVITLVGSPTVRSVPPQLTVCSLQIVPATPPDWRPDHNHLLDSCQLRHTYSRQQLSTIWPQDINWNPIPWSDGRAPLNHQYHLT